jgi:hypothetical protein
MKKESKKIQTNQNRCLGRRDLLKIPGLTTGILFGSVFFPPLTSAVLAESTGKPLKGHVRVGLWGTTLPIPAFIINKLISSGIKKAKRNVQRFSEDKKKIHHFVVRQLPKAGRPISLDYISDSLKISPEKVERLVNELENEKTFLYRNNSDGINWAYPVTVEKTPHRVIFSTGEQVNAA